jgi:N-methylhydantoinase A/oxoprolinase/acetone carboxylase beta subunit
VRVAEAEMLRALRVMTVERGIDPRQFTLMPFGGAGPLHACALADELGIRRILCPRASGVLSALGLAAAAPRRDVSQTVMLRGDAFTAQGVADAREQLLERAAAALDAGQGRAHGAARTTYELRYRGQSFELPVESRRVDPEVLRELFAGLHERRYGYRDDSAEIELVTIRVSVWGRAPQLRVRGAATEHEWVQGPAVRALPEATLFVAAGWSGGVDDWGTVRLERG